MLSRSASGTDINPPQSLGNTALASESALGNAVTQADEALWRVADATDLHDSQGQDNLSSDGWPRGTNSAHNDSVLSFLSQAAPVRPVATLQPLQEWEGHVVAIEEGEFVARLIDLTAGHSHETEEAVIPLAEISEDDASRMAIGSIFRWVIGYRRSEEGTKTRVSQIVFRDLPRVAGDDIRKGEEWAQAVASALR